MTNVLFIPGTYCNYGHLFFVTYFCYLWKRPNFRFDFIGSFFRWDEFDNNCSDQQTKQRLWSVGFCQKLEFWTFWGISANCRCSPFINNGLSYNWIITTVFWQFYSSERFFLLELLATLMKAGSDADNVLIRAPVPEPLLDTKRKWKHNTEEKQHTLQKFALLKFLKDLYELRSMFFLFCGSFCVLRLG